MEVHGAALKGYEMGINPSAPYYNRPQEKKRANVKTCQSLTLLRLLFPCCDILFFSAA